MGSCIVLVRDGVTTLEFATRRPLSFDLLKTTTLPAPSSPPPLAPMAPVSKKSKAAKGTESISARLALVVKSGKYSLGYKSALKQMRNSKGESSHTLAPAGTGA
jgi:hypothetical protein